MQEVEVVGEKIWVLGGEGFGTERARLAQGGSSAERARLAQGKICKIFTYGGSDTFGYKIQKIQIPIRNYFFVGATLKLVEIIKPIR